MKFLIAAAKTGGHVFPASVIAQSLVKKNHEVIFLGTGSEIEKNAYNGWVGCEYNPKDDTISGMKWINNFKQYLF